MSMDVALLLGPMTRESARACGLVMRTEDGGRASGSTRRHRLAARGLLDWEYTVTEGGTTVFRQLCEGQEAARTSTDGSLGVPAPRRGGVDDFCRSPWTEAVDTWLVEMLRPADLLARIRVTSVEEGPCGVGMRLGALPRGDRTPFYQGLAVPDGRTLDMLLDPERGLLLQVRVRTADGALTDHLLSAEAEPGAG
ncbi:hypothetical protein ACOALZ_16345 [Nocardiopsis algeriensis]|uniref:hypothetical protein n=1 Tax=Nocardiopsis algeriensis TaxID=1478215 RepID=UPI003B436E78